MSSSTSLCLQLDLIMSLAATVNEAKAASAGSRAGTSRVAGHLSLSSAKKDQRVEQINLNVGHVVL